MNRNVLALCVIMAAIGVSGLVYVFWFLPDAAPQSQEMARSTPPPFDSTVFEPSTVIPRSFPAIIEPEMATVAEAEGNIQPNELVLGVEVNGETRAYPINMLCGPQREIINDEVGGQAIAATW